MTAPVDGEFVRDVARVLSESCPERPCSVDEHMAQAEKVVAIIMEHQNDSEGQA